MGSPSIPGTGSEDVEKDSASSPKPIINGDDTPAAMGEDEHSVIDGVNEQNAINDQNVDSEQNSDSEKNEASEQKAASEQEESDRKPRETSVEDMKGAETSDADHVDDVEDNLFGEDDKSDTGSAKVEDDISKEQPTEGAVENREDEHLETVNAVQSDKHLDEETPDVAMHDLDDADTTTKTATDRIDEDVEMSGVKENSPVDNGSEVADKIVIEEASSTLPQTNPDDNNPADTNILESGRAQMQEQPVAQNEEIEQTETKKEEEDKNKESLSEELNQTEEQREEEGEENDGAVQDKSKDTLRDESQEDQTKSSIKALDKESEKLAIPQSHEIIIPSYSKWFNLTKIHSIERQSLPEFFTNRIPSKTPQVYVKCRNYMVNSYRLNPNEYLSVTTVRRNICGDSAAIFRMHKFLMKWGLINYQVNASLLPKNVEPPFTGEYSTKHDAPRGLFPFESYKPSVQLPDMAKLKKMMDTNDKNSALHKYIQERKRKIEEDDSTVKAAEQDDIKNKKGETSDEKVDEEELKEANGVKRPKVLKEASADDGWEQGELQKLLKGIQEHGSEWYTVAKEVGTKTPEQCILKFLQLPIEDRFLHQNSHGSDLGPLKYAPHLPFSKSENPVMSTIAFLVGLVDPNVVQEMTQRALKSVEDVKQTNNSEDTAKEGSEIALASLGVRSHVFATSEERQMHSISNELMNVQVQKVEAKLKLLGKIEESLELEKKALQRQQEDVLVQRLALSKHSDKVYGKLNDCVKLLDEADIEKDKLQTNLSELKELLSRRPNLSIGAAFGKLDSNTTSSSSLEHTDAAKTENDVKPVSIDAPQFYRYWSA